MRKSGRFLLKLRKIKTTKYCIVKYKYVLYGQAKEVHKVTTNGKHAVKLAAV
jgi:hypothetical protein